jgi:uncharacterized membrane protein
MITTTVAVRPTSAAGPVRRHRWLIFAVALPALAVKLVIAYVTFGTNDIVHWMDFAQAVKRVGPVQVYAFPFTQSLYNHPPLIGYFLLAVNYLTHFGLPVKFSIRAAASLADVASAFLVFEVLHRRRPLAEATAAGILVAASPVLFAVSGFHGNTDPIFTMLILLSVFLLAERRTPATAGVAIALALSIKIVAVVVVPGLLVYAARRGRRTLVRFVMALGAVFVLIWTPALHSEWAPIRKNVLGYRGSLLHPWGLPQFAQWAGMPDVSNWLNGSGVLVVAVCAGVGAAAVWAKPSLVVEAMALAMVAFMLLSPAFAVQYLVWPVLFCYLVGFWGATAYNVLAGALLVEVYTRWSGTVLWNHAHALAFSAREKAWGGVVWVALTVVVSQGLWRILTVPERHSRKQYALPD